MRWFLVTLYLFGDYNMRKTMIRANPGVRNLADTELRNLDFEPKFLYAYLFEANVLSFVNIPFEMVAFEAGMDLDKACVSIEKLDSLNIVKYCKKNNLFFLPKIFDQNVFFYLEEDFRNLANLLNSYHGNLTFASFLYNKIKSYAYLYPGFFNSFIESVYNERKSLKSLDLEEKSSEKQRKNCPHQKIIDLYHNILPELPKVQDWSPTSRKRLQALWNEFSERKSIDWWRSFFEDYIKTSDFLMGRKVEFKANLAWIVKRENFSKILNG
ncbi:MAG: hypothetical protein ACOCWW_04605, partial [Bacteroidota bacterium]